jgi:hypothetical protein
MKLTTPVIFTNAISPICIPIMDKSFVGNTGIVTGWGDIYTGGPISSTLRQVNITIRPREDCNVKRFLQTIKLTNNQFCAGKTSPIRDSCQVKIVHLRIFIS